MVSIFKSYHPAIIFLLLLYTMLLRAVFFIEPPSFHAPFVSDIFAKFIFYIIEIISVDKEWVYHMIALFLVLFQALYFNYLINYYRLLNKSSYLPAMAYILISSLFSEFIVLSPALIANTFLLFSLSKMLSVYKKEKALAIIFDAGLLIAIAALIFIPYIVFYLFILGSLIILRPFNLRECILSLLGLAVPYYFIIVYFFWYNRLPEFMSTIQVSAFNFSVDQIKFSPQVILIGITLLLVVLWALFYIQSNIFKMVVQVRSYLVVFMLMFVAGFLSLFIEFDGRFDHFLWIASPIALAFSIFFMEQQRKWISEMVHLFLILTVLFYQYNFLLK